MKRGLPERKVAVELKVLSGGGEPAGRLVRGESSLCGMKLAVDRDADFKLRARAG